MVGFRRHPPTTAAQSSSVRSNLHICKGQLIGGTGDKARYIKSRELDIIRKRRRECVGCLDGVSSMKYPVLSERTAQNTVSTCGRYSCA